MTEQHANIISAFANNEIGSASGFSASLGNGKIPFEDQKRKTFDEEAPAESDGTFAKENQGDNGTGNVCESRQKTYLKQNIFFQNNAEYDDDDDGDRQQDKVGPQIHIHLLLTILCALRQHAISDRMRLKRLLEKSTSPDTTNKQHHIMSMDISKALDSFNNSVRAIVDIGERILLRLPTNSHSCRLGGMVVRGLLEAYLDSDILASRKNHSMAYMAYEEGSKLKSLVDPLRYAYSVSNAAESPQLDPKKDRNQNSKTGIEDSTSASQLIGTQPPKDVQDVVKALFMRDLVDFQTSGCGFGDFLCWCNLPIYPQRKSCIA